MRGRSLLGIGLVSLFFNATPTAVAVAADAGASLKSRMSDLIEVIPRGSSTTIELYGVAPPPDTLRTSTRGAFRVRGEILALGNERDDLDNSTTYVISEIETYQGSKSRTAIEVQDNEVDAVPGPETDERIDRLVEGQTHLVDEPPDTINSRFSSVHFFNGKFDGTPATLILLAEKHRAWGSPAAGLDASENVLISLYELQADDTDLPGHFIRMAHFVTASSYCNTDTALWREMAIPLPAVYSGKLPECDVK